MTQDGLRLRKARPGDLDAIHALELSVFDGDQLSRASLRRFIVAPSAHMAVAHAGPAFLGYSLTGFRKGSTKARLYSIAVDPAAGRKGVGRALLQAAEAAARRRGATDMVLEVRADNARAIALYEGMGYRRFDTLEAYYEDGATALRMTRPLKGAKGGEA